MLIALDARTIYRSSRRGIGKSLLDLYRHLPAVRPDWRVMAYHRDTYVDPDLLPASHVEPKRIEMIGDRFHAWERYRLPLAAWRDDADVLHCPANTCPEFLPAKTVVTIHDLIPLDRPEDSPSDVVHRFEHCVKAACRDAAHILCPSQYTRNRLVNEFGANPQRISVNHWAPSDSIHWVNENEQAAVAGSYGVSQPFVLHLGAAAPRKNTQRVLEAWQGIPAILRKAWKLLVVGLDDLTMTKMQRTVRKLRLQESVVLHGFAPEIDMPGLFSAASVLAYPSLSEGFGLPILDAWRARCAVLTSNSTSLPEVAGDAAMLVQPEDSSAITRGLRCLVEDADLRQQLVRRGQQRLTQFTWTASAQRFASAIEAAAGVRASARWAAA